MARILHAGGHSFLVAAITSIGPVHAQEFYTLVQGDIASGPAMSPTFRFVVILGSFGSFFAEYADHDTAERHREALVKEWEQELTELTRYATVPIAVPPGGTLWHAPRPPAGPYFL